MARAMATPSGTSMARIMAQKVSWRASAAWKRSECSTCSNHFTPSKKNILLLKVSWTE
jgi:RNase P subunit RPR2